MRRYILACLLPVLAVVVLGISLKPRAVAQERITPVQKSMKLYDMEQRQDEMNRAVLRFRLDELE